MMRLTAKHAKLPLNWLRGLGRSLRIVGAAMVGIRGKESHEQDTAALSPLLLVIVVVSAMVFFVTALVTLAIFVVGAQ
jgi:Protein of unknown function (DUF2970)